MADETSHRPNRQQNRERITSDIMEAARRQIREVGAAGLSLRSVARQVGMVSSAVYRYVDSRDELLTRLIIEAYDSLGDDVERASAARDDVTELERWVAAGTAARQWAIHQPHEYLLLFGSPVPGYAAPERTAGPGTRVPRALASIVRDAAIAGHIAETWPETDAAALPSSALTAELESLAVVIDTPVEPATLVALISGWTQMFGLISFELTNQTRGIVEDHAGLFDAAVTRSGRQVGLR